MTKRKETRTVLAHRLYPAMSAAGETEGTFAGLAIRISRDTGVNVYRVLEILDKEERSR